MASASRKATLNCEKAHRGVWLVKVPKFVKDAWTRTVEGELEEDGVSGPALGTVTLKYDPLAPEAVPEASLHLTTAEAANLPKDYNLTFDREFTSMVVLSNDPHTRDGNQDSVVGKVDYKIVAQPSNQDDMNYIGLSRYRMQNASKSRRTVEEMSEKEGRKHISIVPVNSSYGRGRNVKAEKQDRKLRKEKSALQDELFALFGKRSAWAFKDLVGVTEQPSQYLKEVLTEICVFNKFGPNKDKWEVKTQYRNKRSNQAVEGASPSEEPSAKRVKLEH